MIEGAMPSLSDMEWQFVSSDIYQFSAQNYQHILPELLSPAGHSTPRDWRLNVGVHQTLGALDLSNLQSLTLRIPKNLFTDAFDTRRRDAYSSVRELVLINSAIHRVSTKLRHLRISGYLWLTPHLFWPDSATTSSAEAREANAGHVSNASSSIGAAEAGAAGLERQAKEPFWPHLETFLICLKGQQQFFSSFFRSYYEPIDPDSDIDEDEYDDDDVREAHYQRHWAEFTELIVAMSRAMLRMPKLERLSAGSSDCWATPGYAIDYDRTKAAQARPGNVVFDSYWPLDTFTDDNRWELEETDETEIMDNWHKLIQQVQAADKHPGISS